MRNYMLRRAGQSIFIMLGLMALLILLLSTDIEAQISQIPNDRAIQWIGAYDQQLATLRDLVVSPDGQRVFVTGPTHRGGFGFDWQTRAHDAATGAVLWVTYFTLGDDHPSTLTISPDGTRVYVAGHAGANFALVAYDAATGAQLWSTLLANGLAAYGWGAVAVSPDGTRVFVTGTAVGGGDYDYMTAGYNAATGTQFWAARYDGPFIANGTVDDQGLDLAVSPDGGRVYVTGISKNAANHLDGATLAYEASTGTQLWLTRYDGPGSGLDALLTLRVSRDGNRVYVAGSSTDIDGGEDYTIIAYDSATGAQSWKDRFEDLGGGGIVGIAVSLDGGKVFVTGGSMGGSPTVAYESVTGTRLWVARYLGPAGSYQNGAGRSIVPSPDGSKIYVYGDLQTADGRRYVATVAFKTVDGGLEWAAWSSLEPSPADAIGVSPDDSLVFTMTRNSVIAYSTIPVNVKIVDIDIKPGSFPNSINPGPGGTVPVAIFSSANFDATTVDPLTITLASAPVKLKGNGAPNASSEDVNLDGLLDLVVHVSTEALQLSEVDIGAILEGQTLDGIHIRGADTVRVVLR